MKARLAGGIAALVATAWCTTSVQASGYLQPGQFMGLAIGAPLPEGVFFSDLQSYGQSDRSSSYLGVNIPVISWSTPFSFYNTRLIISYSSPWLQQGGAPQLSNANGGARVDVVSQAFGATLAHSFGGGFSASISAFARAPDNILHTTTGTDFFAGLSYTANGFDISATFTYSGVLGSNRGTPRALAGLAGLTGITGSNDAVGVDFTASKHFDKFEFGLVGFAFTDINTRIDNAGFNLVGVTPEGLPILQEYDKRRGEVALGGLVGYNFGRFTLQGIATRDIAKRFAYNGPSGPLGLFGAGAFETRGWVRLIVPLYIAPAPPAPVVARF